jgi:hypothetical protein
VKKVDVQKGRRGKKVMDKQRDVLLCILAISFLLGTVLGTTVENSITTEPYILRFLQDCTQGGVKASFWREAWTILRWPAGVLVLSILPFSLLTIPTLFFFRSFFLAYGVAAVSGGTGMVGNVCAGLMFGPTCLLTVPVLFVLGTMGLLRKAEKQPIPLEHGGLCLGALALCILLDQTAVPFTLSCFLRLVS